MLTSFDTESGNSGSSEDPYGFSSSAQLQCERLQKRNAEIKRNLSLKSEDWKNRRPKKSYKTKAKNGSTQKERTKQGGDK